MNVTAFDKTVIPVKVLGIDIAVINSSFRPYFKHVLNAGEDVMQFRSDDVIEYLHLTASAVRCLPH